MAFEREWPDPQFVAEVEEAFPDQGIANVEEARVIKIFTAFRNSHSHGSLSHSLSCFIIPVAKNMLLFRRSYPVWAGNTLTYGRLSSVKMLARSKIPSMCLW